MRKRWKVLIAIGCLACIMAGLLLTPAQSEGPFYRDRTLFVWLCGLDDTMEYFYWETESIAELRDGVRQIGTNGIPHLLKWLTYEPRPTPTEMRISSFMEKFPLLARYRYIPFYDRRPTLASRHFGALGPAAEEAIPSLVQLAKDHPSREVRDRALMALKSIGPKASPALYAIVTNVKADRITAHTLDTLDTLIRRGTNAAPAIPALLTCLKNPDWILAGGAADTLGKIHAEPERVVPALIEALGYGEGIRGRAAEALGNFGQRASNAVPSLLSYLGKPDHTWPGGVTNALLKIAPEVLTNAPVQ